MNTVQLKDTLDSLKLRVQEFDNSIMPSIMTYKDDIKKLSEVIAKIEESWSGSWIGFHANLYYRDYKKPKWDESFNSEWGSINGIPKSWEEKNYDDISSFINANYNGSNISDMLNFLNQKARQAKEIQLNLCTELSLIRDFINFDKELELLEKMENIKWVIRVSDFIEYRRPKQIWSRDTFALSQGTKIPPHVQYQANVLYCKSMINHIESFVELSRRLIRQIEVRGNVTSGKSVMQDSISIILGVCKRFDVVARQLKKRHKNRSTLEIQDEYDAQDLLHSLLKIHFDDIRPEEWVPSYAGSTSRMDFLLKKEKMVVEVKKTRENLADKEIGEQLLIDIAKYKQHSDCKTLICFVYDPDRKIGNPRGLENDLDRLSNEDMNVITIVAPS